MIRTRSSRLGDTQGPYEAALDAALDDLAHARQDEAAARDRLHQAEGRVTELVQLIQNLVGVLPADRRAAYLDRLNHLRIADQTPTRSGPIYDNVISLLSRTRRREWTASEIQEELAKEGEQADPKAVYNVLGYLARRGRLKRLGRGRYFVTGLGGIQLDQDIDGVDPGEGGSMYDD